MKLRFTEIDSSAGRLVAASTDKGLRLLEFLEEGETPEDRIRVRFPDAELQHAPRSFGQLRAELKSYFSGKSVRFGVPLDLEGTPFQQKVWKELARMPLGETATYTELAERVGRPDAVRAVAGAVAANHIAILMPCHRMVRKGGALGGFRWGPSRKQVLLDLESRAAGRR